MPTSFAKCGFNELVSVSIHISPVSSASFKYSKMSFIFLISLYFLKSIFFFSVFSFLIFFSLKSISPYAEITELNNLLNSISLKKV